MTDDSRGRIPPTTACVSCDASVDPDEWPVHRREELGWGWRTTVECPECGTFFTVTAREEPGAAE